MTYEEVRAELCERYGWGFDQVDNLTFDQIESAWVGGKRGPVLRTKSIKELRDMARDWRKHLGI